MKTVLMLATKMQMGFGVSVVVSELSRRLIAKDYNVIVGAIEYDNHFPDSLEIIHVTPDASTIRQLVFKRNIDIVVAHTSPYFELLPNLTDFAQTIAWEHGDPTPELFVHDRIDRHAIVTNKRRNVYPLIDQVIAISGFIKREIEWPNATIIHNGADHLPAVPPGHNAERPLAIGSLMRLGKGERFYKGGEFLVDLANQLKLVSPESTVSVMGRGTKEDAAFFIDHGINVHLNATDEERSTYLSEIDIFFSPSIWEGFNLPLVEAQMSGALAVALDVGAHPEVTPFVFSSVPDLVHFIQTLDTDRQRLLELSNHAQTNLISRFNWTRAADQFVNLIQGSIRPAQAN